MNLTAIKGKPRAIDNRVLAIEMYFGEQTTSSGIILSDDNGKSHGIYPRWAKVYSKGPNNTDPYSVGEWILVKHGRWSRSMLIDDGSGEFEVRLIDPDGIIAWSDEKPSDEQLGSEYSDGASMDVNPEDFINR